MTKIRVTYSGLISFGVGMIGVITGMIFILIVTRQLTKEELGIWTLIGGLISYFVITEATISYWITREVARGLESGKTAIVVSGVFSAGSSVIYLVVAFIVAQQSRVDEHLLFFAVLLIPVMFLNRTIGAINAGWKPQVVSYGSLVFESLKIPAGLILVYILHLGVFGAILVTFVAYLASIIIQFYYVRTKIRNKIKVQYLKKWIKLSWLTYYPQIANLITKFDVLVYAMIVGSVTGLAYYTAAVTVSSVVGQSASISRGLYVKLLEEDKREYLQENLTRVLYFIIPITALSVVFAHPALFVLNPLYEGATIITIFMTIRMFFSTLGSVFYPALIGIEKVDLDENATFRDYLKSKLFFLPSLSILQSIIYLALLTTGLLIMSADKSTDLNFVMYWAIITLGIEIPFTAYLFILVRRNFVFQINYNAISKYLGTSIAVFGVAYILSQRLLVFEKSIFQFLPNLLIFVFAGVIAYLAITYLIDKKTRNLFNSIINEIRGQKNY
ncbi:MAG: hypothetical protein ACRDFB_06545 [Rhabdochlamydiaceae bacterium]